MENRTAEMIKGMKYRITHRFGTDEVIYLGPDDNNNPVLCWNNVSIMIPWQAIESLEPVSE
jgi:hypothetical protein